jgi:hypothetical protein
MTGPEPTAPEPVAEPYAVVEAFLDGEAVDPGKLRHALDEPGVKDHLVDLLVLREGVRAISPGSWSSSDASTGGSRLRWLAVAAAVVMALSAGYYTGQRTVLASAPRGGETIVAVESAPAPPKPTQVIRLEPGVNWTDGPAGK